VDKLYVVERVEDKKPTVLGALEKQENAFVYTPTEHAQSSVFKWTLEPFSKKNLPSYIRLRIPGPHKVSLPKILGKYGLKDYDEWELLKATRGFSAKDSLTFEYNQRLEEMFMSVKSITEVPHDDRNFTSVARNYKKVYSRNAMLRKLNKSLYPSVYKPSSPAQEIMISDQTFKVASEVLRRSGAELISATKNINDVLNRHNTIIKGIGERQTDLAGIEQWRIFKKSLEEQSAGRQTMFQSVETQAYFKNIGMQLFGKNLTGAWKPDRSKELANRQPKGEGLFQDKDF